MTPVFSFTRVEPVSRGGDPGRGLAATVQDPFWMLARQRLTYCGAQDHD